MPGQAIKVEVRYIYRYKIPQGELYQGVIWDITTDPIWFTISPSNGIYGFGWRKESVEKFLKMWREKYGPLQDGWKLKTPIWEKIRPVIVRQAEAIVEKSMEVGNILGPVQVVRGRLYFPMPYGNEVATLYYYTVPMNWFGIGKTVEEAQREFIEQIRGYINEDEILRKAYELVTQGW